MAKVSTPRIVPDWLLKVRACWDEEAASFDDEPDHGLRDASVKSEWSRLLNDVIGPHQRDIVDLGCGSGSLSLLLSELGHQVVGLDISPRMLDLARKKTGTSVEFVEGDASAPQLPSQYFDIVLCRHVLWSLPDQVTALKRWEALLRPGGTMVLIEGRWETGAGLSPEEICLQLPAGLDVERIQNLSSNDHLWGKRVSDERFLLIAKKKAAQSHDE